MEFKGEGRRREKEEWKKEEEEEKRKGIRAKGATLYLNLKFYYPFN